MDKPKGGRGKTAPYDTKQMRIPIGLEPQIQELISRYREWISRSGSNVVGANNPPWLLDKPVDSFSKETLLEVNAKLKAELAEAQGEINFQEARWKLTERQNNGLAAEIRRIKSAPSPSEDEGGMSVEASPLNTPPLPKSRRRKLKGDQLSPPVLEPMPATATDQAPSDIDTSSKPTWDAKVDSFLGKVSRK